MTRETYANSGVHLDSSSQIKDWIKEHVRSTFGPQVIGNVGFFGALYRLQDFREPVIVSSTDGVGTKVKLAALLGRYDTVGQDLVNHCINDVFTCGARPLFFLDYIAMGEIAPECIKDLVRGMTTACRAAGCALIGGETAEMPGMYTGNDFDMAGFLVGAVEQDEVLDNDSIQEGDVLLGLASSGPHTNGYSLIRQVFDLDRNPAPLQERYSSIDCTLGEALMEPHRPYYPLLEPVLPLIKGMAHITGGGLLENLPRVLPKGLTAYIDRDSWQVPPVFSIIQHQGTIDDEEMFRVFNMGVGMVLVCSKEYVGPVTSEIPEAWVAGRVVRTNGTDRMVFK